MESFMKLFLLAALMLSTSASFASAVCPQGSTQVKSCKSTPQAGDHQFAIEMANSIAICSEGKEYSLIIEKNGISDDLGAKKIVRAGATTYVADADTIVLKLTTIVNGRKVNNAKLSVEVESADISGSSTYSCN
jgi:hypothetical protein